MTAVAIVCACESSRVAQRSLCPRTVSPLNATFTHSHTNTAQVCGPMRSATVRLTIHGIQCSHGLKLASGFQPRLFLPPAVDFLARAFSRSTCFNTFCSSTMKARRILRQAHRINTIASSLQAPSSHTRHSLQVFHSAYNEQLLRKSIHAV